jgi:hypothetical protein
MKTNTSFTQSSKHLFYLLLTTLLLFACGTKERTQESIKWINTAKKPIRVYNHRINGFNYNHDYTLIDSTGNVYYTGEINLTLPDTIR